MATAKEFVARVSRIDGVSGCLLIRRDDGTVLGRTLEDAEVYSTLLLYSSSPLREVTQHTGFRCCRHFSFARKGRGRFHVFPIEQFLLGVVQEDESHLPGLIDKIDRLLRLVSTAPAADAS